MSNHREDGLSRAQVPGKKHPASSSADTSASLLEFALKTRNRPPGIADELLGLPLDLAAAAQVVEILLMQDHRVPERVLAGLEAGQHKGWRIRAELCDLGFDFHQILYCAAVVVLVVRLEQL